MADYDVHVEGMVSRIITVEAKNQEEANELAKEEFNLGERMDTYEVMIKATTTKSVVVDASNVQEAEELAHQMFSATRDGPGVTELLMVVGIAAIISVSALVFLKTTDESNIQEAEELAHQMFSATCDGPDEKYEQETIGSTQLIK